MRRPVWMYAVPALVAGLLSGQTLAAQAHMGGGKDAMPAMANCSMMGKMNMNGTNMSGATGKGMMDGGMGNMMSMMMSMSGCPMMPGAAHTAPAQHQ